MSLIWQHINKIGWHREVNRPYDYSDILLDYRRFFYEREGGKTSINVQ